MSATDARLAYSLAALLLTLTPGLDTALILRTASATAYDIVKWCGALWLLWPGTELILRPRQSFSTAQGDVPAPQSNGFIRGMLGNVLNPKGTLWSLALIMVTGKPALIRTAC